MLQLYEHHDWCKKSKQLTRHKTMNFIHSSKGTGTIGESRSSKLILRNYNTVLCSEACCQSKEVKSACPLPTGGRVSGSSPFPTHWTYPPCSSARSAQPYFLPCLLFAYSMQNIDGKERVHSLNKGMELSKLFKFTGSNHANNTCKPCKSTV